MHDFDCAVERHGERRSARDLRAAPIKTMSSEWRSSVWRGEGDEQLRGRAVASSCVNTAARTCDGTDATVSGDYTGIAAAAAAAAKQRAHLTRRPRYCSTFAAIR